MSGSLTYRNNGGDLSKIAGAEDIYDKYLEVMQDFNEYSDPATATERALNGILSKKQFAGLEDSLTSAAQSGKEALSQLINSTPELTSALEKAGIGVDELQEHFLALANPDTLNLDHVKSQLKDLYDET